MQQCQALEEKWRFILIRFLLWSGVFLCGKESFKYGWKEHKMMHGYRKSRSCTAISENLAHMLLS